MANTINYAIQFKNDLMQKYTRELRTAGLTTNSVNFVGTNQIKIPYLILAGYKDHGRNGGFNRQAIENRFLTKTLSFDRDVEFFVDSMDVDETNQVVAAANITNTFEEEKAIPEEDAYRVSKLYSDWIAAGGVADTTALTIDNVLTEFDSYMQEMDEEEVPIDGRILYVIPAVETLLKNASKLTRQYGGDTAINRAVRSLDNVTLVPITPGRSKTAYDFTDGFVPAIGAKQINMMLVHPRSVITCNKHSYIHLWTPGTHTQGDGYLYQNRKYYDLFVVDTRVKGIKINRDV